MLALFPGEGFFSSRFSFFSSGLLFDHFAVQPQFLKGMVAEGEVGIICGAKQPALSRLPFWDVSVAKETQRQT